MAAQVQEVNGDAVALACVDQASTGAQAAQDAPAHHRQLAVVKLSETRKGFGLPPERWVVKEGTLRFYDPVTAQKLR